MINPQCQNCKYHEVDFNDPEIFADLICVINGTKEKTEHFYCCAEYEPGEWLSPLYKILAMVKHDEREQKK